MENFYEKNLNALIQVDPLLGASLFAIQQNEQFEVFQGKDMLDINLLDTQRNDFLYQKPIDNLEAIITKIDKEYLRYPVLFFYGIGNGLYLKGLLGNASLKHLVVIEPNLELIYIALNFVDLSEEIANERLIIKHSQNFDFASGLKIIYKKDVKPYTKIYMLHIHSEYYETNFAEDIQRVNQLLLRCHKHMVLGHGNDTIDSLIGIEHHISNLPTMLQNYKTSDMFKSKNSEIAVIVSTGPSLSKQLPLLKEYAPYITIICIDASLPILQKHNIAPDIVVSMERVQLTSKFFLDLDPKLTKNTYFVVSSLTHPDTVKNLKDQKLLLSMRPLAYMKYFELHDFGYLGSGMSAANMGHQLATFMNYDTIILIGQDLAYADDGKSHAKGHIFSENDVKHSENDLYVQKYGGEGEVRTTYVWDMFKNHFEKEIAHANEFNITTYNATEGGARIVGSIEKPFKTLLEELVDKQKEKTSIKIRKVRKDTFKKLLALSQEKIDAMVEYGKNLKEKVESTFLKVTAACEEIEKIKKEEINYDHLLSLIDEIDKIKEEVESLEFSKMYVDTVQSYIFHQELELAKLMIENSTTQEEKKAKLVKWIEAHQFWLFSLAGGIEAQLLTIEKGLQNRPQL